MCTVAVGDLLRCRCIPGGRPCPDAPSGVDDCGMLTGCLTGDTDRLKPISCAEGIAEEDPEAAMDDRWGREEGPASALALLLTTSPLEVEVTPDGPVAVAGRDFAATGAFKAGGSTG